MSAIEGMFKQYLQPLQQDVAAIKAYGVSRDELKESLDPIKHDVQMLTVRIDSLEQAGTRSPSVASGAVPSIAPEIEHKIR
eukprot:2876118-Pyramimonas_sp.AAC.1